MNQYFLKLILICFYPVLLFAATLENMQTQYLAKIGYKRVLHVRVNDFLDTLRRIIADEKKEWAALDSFANEQRIKIKKNIQIKIKNDTQIHMLSKKDKDHLIEIRHKALINGKKAINGNKELSVTQEHILWLQAEKEIQEKIDASLLTAQQQSKKRRDFIRGALNPR